MRKNILSLILITLSIFTYSATITYNGDGINTNWETADNWDLDRVPTIGDDVVLTGAIMGSRQVILSVGQNVTVNSVTFGDIESILRIHGTLTITGDLIFDDASEASVVRIYCNSSGNGILEIQGSVDFGSGADNELQVKGLSSGIASTLKLGGGYSGSGGSITLGTKNSVLYNGSSAQTIYNGTYVTLSTSGTGVKTINGPIIATTFNAGDAIINIADAGTLTTSMFNGNTSTIGVAGILNQPTTSFTANTCSISYNKAGAQSGIAAMGAYNNLLFEGSGTKSLGGDFDVNGDLTITSDLYCATGNLTVAGDWINNGSFDANLKTVTFDGDNQDVGGSTATTFYNLILDNTAITLNGSVNIHQDGAVTFTNSTLNVNSQTMTFKSNTGTEVARIATATGSSSITGDITVERYMPTGTGSTNRKWWHWGVPLTNVAVSEIQDDYPVTGDFTGASVLNTSNPSMYSYDESNTGTLFSQGWTAFPTSSNTENLTRGQGYSMFVRTSNSDVSEKVIDVTGGVDLGTKVITLNYTETAGDDANVDGWNLIANPFVSPIDFAALTRGSNVDDYYYHWDAKSDDWGGYWISGSPNVFGSNGTQYIQPFQGFWMHTSGNSNNTVTFDQADKVSDQVTLRRPLGEEVDNKLEVLLETKGGVSGSNDKTLAEIYFDEFKSEFYAKGEDMIYLSRNVMIDNDFNTSRYVDVFTYSLDGKKLLKNGTSVNEETIIPIGLKGNGDLSYVLKLINKNIDQNIEVVLFDKLLNVLTPVRSGINYSFEVDPNNEQASIEDRFEVVTSKRALGVENHNDFKAQVLTNPFNGKLLSVAVNGEADYTISVLDAIGNVINTTSYSSNGEAINEIRFENKLPSGVYFVNIVSELSKSVQRVVVE